MPFPKICAFCANGAHEGCVSGDGAEPCACSCAFARRPFSSEPAHIDQFLELMFCTWELNAWAKTMDGPELVFWMHKSAYLDQLIFGSLPEAIWEAIETKLYPEYDGDKVTMTEWGYNTPAGPIRYLHEDGTAIRPARHFRLKIEP